MSIRIDNNTFELKITPNKRKRDLAKDKQQAHHNKENNFVFNNFMEVKSIADLVKQKASSMSSDDKNPYELVRKPPKKKTKHDIDGNCFVNQALNINGPEIMFNPFEVKRMPNIEQENHCFTNPGLNIRGAERDVVNPFEVMRDVVPLPIATDVQGKNIHNRFKLTNFDSTINSVFLLGSNFRHRKSRHGHPTDIGHCRAIHADCWLSHRFQQYSVGCVDAVLDAQ